MPVFAPELIGPSLTLSAVLFCIGVMGVLFRRNILIIFMCVELMLNAANLSLVAFGRALGSMDGQVLVFFALAVAAAEVAVGLAIIIDLFRKKGTVDVEQVSLLRG